MSPLSECQDAPPSPKTIPRHAAHAAFRRVPSLVDRFTKTPDATKLVFVMVGLPARGKSFISLRLARFLEWTGTETRVFNVGNQRRTTETDVQDASYFDPNSGTAARREQIAMQVLTDMLVWLGSGEERYAIFDATNSTKARRAAVADKLRSNPALSVIFLESICDDPAVLEANILQKLMSSPDYSETSNDLARQDLLERIGHYDKVYESVTESAIILGKDSIRTSYIKLFNLSSHVVAHNIWGRAASTVLPFLMSLHVGSRPVWLVRQPDALETPSNWRNSGKPWPPPVEVRFSEQTLSPDGIAFLDDLQAFSAREASNIAVFCCHHRRSLEVAERFGGGRVRTSLNPQDRGQFAGLTAAEIVDQAPDIWADPVCERFPGGENLGDMLQRLVHLLIELEQEMRPVLVVAPLSALQLLYCFYAGLPIKQALTVSLPMHTVTEMRPNGGKFTERRLNRCELRA